MKLTLIHQMDKPFILQLLKAYIAVTKEGQILMNAVIYQKTIFHQLK